MAFIRWKKLKHGTWKAYLVQSYRDEQGRPRHKTLAYLGDQAQLAAEHVAQLKARYPDLSIDWDKIRPPAPPKRADISGMSDGELLENLRSLRRERGIPAWFMPRRLESAGAARAMTASRKGRGLGIKDYIKIENALADGEEQDFYENPVRDLAPAARKVLCSA